MLRLSCDYQCIIAGIFHLRSKVPAHIAVGIAAGSRGFGAKMGFAAGWQEMTGEWAGSGNQHILRIKGLDIRRNLIIQHFRHKASATDEVFRQRLGQRLLADGSSTQVDA